ncbi:sensor domain-containing phosphodiesterase [Paenacidovorax monticola]|uniref:EAL domain-containing protein n=1 Tax=Paenacidovorax monticola TaxID=1926868 RepID=A0A7H0HGX5_9BURK|nr:EAL domain-containing protein [Paenacidovorax monticola]QNP59791.1 EAL domain-containing protein [Paenacidovorax monticola]
MQSTESVVEGNCHLVQLMAPGVCAEGVDRMLRAIRKHLGMDVAFISHFRPPERVLTHVDSVPDGPLRQEQSIPLQEGYCLKVVQGELPQCIPDTARVPATQHIPATHAIHIGSHLSVPIRLEDGQIYGTLCCFSYQPNPSLGEHDIQLMHTFADILAARLDESAAAERAKEDLAREVRSAMADGIPRIVFQPICRIADKTICGFESLSRFDIEPRRSPDKWFEIAQKADQGLELELHAITKALTALEHLPQSCSLSVNSSPELILTGRLHPLLDQMADLSRLVLEITEHAAVHDYVALALSLSPFRQRGARLAVDDAGAGYSSMRHILNLAPEIIKLDISLTQHIDSDAKRRALAKGLTSFAHKIGSLVIAEGVERSEELDMLQKLGVDCAQGYLLSKPLELEAAAVFTLS